MPVLPKSLFVLGASFLTTRTAHRLKRRHAAAAQRATLRTLLDGFACTEQGRQHGLAAGLGYDDFRRRMPLRGRESIAAAAERMKRGERDILWPGTCSYYALTSGTTGPVLPVPVTPAMVAHFRRAGLESLLAYTARVGHAAVFRGRHLLLDGAPAPAILEESRPFEAVAGSLGGMVALNLPDWVRRHFFEPGLESVLIPDPARKLAAIAERTQHADVTLLAGTPRWIGMFVDAVHRQSGAIAHLQELWPNLECVVHTGMPASPVLDELRRLAGPTARFHEVYAAAEGIIAAQEMEPEAGLRLLVDAGLFFEFVPLADFDETLPAALAEKARPLEDVRAGVDYVLLLSTPAGLCRYVLGDIVRFTTVDPPRLVYVGRTKLQLNAFGEHVQERHLTDTLVAVCQRHGWSIVNFHVAPLAVSNLTGQKRGRHEWWVELRPGTVATPTGPILATELDRELAARSKEYAARRTASMEPPAVRLVMPGFFEHWMKHQGGWSGQHKLPRCRSDRQIADNLTALACFTPD